MRLLKANEIEVKVKQVKENGCVALLYKTARTDMDLLDETYGPENWQDAYEEIKGNLYCKIGVWSEKRSQWIWKQDCGIESREDGEGNEKKGEASDAFKRAGFRWGIGRELYTAPFIWISSDVIKIDVRNGKAYTNEKFSVKKIEYNDNREIIALEIVNSKNKVVYTFNTKTPIVMAKTEDSVDSKPTLKELHNNGVSIECQRAINDAQTLLELKNVYNKYAATEPVESLKTSCAAKKELLVAMMSGFK